MEKDNSKFCLTFKNIVFIFCLCALVCLTAKSVSNIVRIFAISTYESKIFRTIHLTFSLCIIAAIIVILIYKWKIRGKCIDLVNKYKYYIVFVVTILFIFSFICFNESRYDIEHLKNIINIQWTIFAIISTLYIFWHGFTFDKIKDSITNKEKKNETNFISIKEDIKFYNTYSAIITPILLLGLDTIHLLITTYLTYIKNDESILNQNNIIFGIVLTANLLVYLIIEIIFFEFQFKKIVVDKRFVAYDTISNFIEKDNKTIIQSNVTTTTANKNTKNKRKKCKKKR